MKRFIFFVFIFILFVGTINFAAAGLEVSGISSLTLFRNENISSSFIVKNTGNETIENITFFADLPKGVTISFNQTNFDLNANSSIVVGFNLTASFDASLGEHTVRINATGRNGSASFTFLLKIKKHYCSYGKRGNALWLEIQEPDEKDIFYAGEKIYVELTLENRNNEKDVVVEVELFDPSEEEPIADASLEDTIDEDEEKDYTLELKIPYDINQGNYFLYIKAYEDGNEEEECVEKEIMIGVRKKARSLVIDKKTFSPVVACGDPLGLTLKIANAGRKDEKDVKVRVYNEEINFSSEQVKDISAGARKNFFFEDTLPIVAPGKYLFKIHISSDYVNVYDSFELELKDNCRVELKNVSLRAETLTTFVGQETRIKIIARNTGNVKTNYLFGVKNYESWTSLVKVEPESLELDPGEEGIFFVVLVPNDKALPENYLNVLVTFDGITVENLIVVNVRKETKGASLWEQFFFEIERNKGLAIFILCLIILIIVLSVALARKRRTREVLKKEKKQKR